MGEVHVGPPGAVPDITAVLSPQLLMTPSVVPRVTEVAARRRGVAAASLTATAATEAAARDAAASAAITAEVRASRDVCIRRR
jgi:hypothetical protein